MAGIKMPPIWWKNTFWDDSSTSNAMKSIIEYETTISLVAGQGDEDNESFIVSNSHELTSASLNYEEKSLSGLRIQVGSVEQRLSR